MIHRLDVLIWQKTDDGHKGRNAPQPITPPAPAHTRSDQAAEDVRRSLAENRARLASRNPSQHQEQVPN